MAKIIQLSEKRKQKEIERKEMAEVDKMIRKINELPRLDMWANVCAWIMAFFPWLTYFFILWLAKPNLTMPQLQEVKLVGALIAVMISPIVTLAVAQLVSQEMKTKINGKN